MMKQCPYCGQFVEDTAPICAYCQNPLAVMPVGGMPVTYEMPAPPKKKGKAGKIIGIIAIALVGLLIAGAGCVWHFWMSDEAQVKRMVRDYFTAFNDHREIDIVSCEYPPSLSKQFGGAAELSAAKKVLLDDLAEVYGKDWDIEYSVLNVEKIDKTEFQEIRDSYYNVYDLAIDDALEVEISYKLGKDEERAIAVCYESGDKWYMPRNLITVSGAGSPEEALNLYFNALNDRDVQAIMRLYYPPKTLTEDERESEQKTLEKTVYSQGKETLRYDIMEGVEYVEEATSSAEKTWGFTASRHAHVRGIVYTTENNDTAAYEQEFSLYEYGGRWYLDVE